MLRQKMLGCQRQFFTCEDRMNTPSLISTLPDLEKTPLSTPPLQLLHLLIVNHIFSDN